MLGSERLSRKRLRSELPQPNSPSHPTSKRQKFTSEPPASFWDNLSKFWLTKRALKELDRRNTEAAAKPSRTPYLQRVCQRRATQYPAADYIRACEPRILRDIQQFARQGGPDLSDIRNYLAAAATPIDPSDRAMPPSQSSRSRRSNSSANPSSTAPTSTARSGAYERNFDQHLKDNGIFPDEYEYPDGIVPGEPSNWDDLNQRMTQTRRSLSPSRVSDQFKQLRRGNAHAAKEKQVSELVIPIIEGKIPDVRCRAGGVPFNNFDPLTDVTLKHANPDIYYGALPEELSRKVRDELCGRIIPSTQHNLPMVPNFFVETKGPDGSIAVAKRQACYNGAFGARSMHSLKMYGKSPDVYDNKACTVTSTFHDGNLKLYTSHIALSHTSSNRPVYYMNQLGAYSLTGSKRIFIEGVTAYRNMRDWTEEQRSEAIQNANARVEAEANHIEAGALADGGASPAASFVTAVDADEVYTMTQEEYGLPPDEDDVEGQLESDSSDGATSVYTFPAKRSKSKGQHHPRRKRHNADASSSLTSISQDPVGVGATTKQSGTWSWVNGKFQNYHGQDRLKEQHNNPVDVWVYFEGGWPGQKGEKWRWVSATGETKYS